MHTSNKSEIWVRNTFILLCNYGSLIHDDASIRLPALELTMRKKRSLIKYDVKNGQVEVKKK